MVAVDLSPYLSLVALLSYGWKHDYASTLGVIRVYNHCDYPLYLRSVGARRLMGPRSNIAGPNAGHESFDTPADYIMTQIASGKHYEEPYRTSCYQLNSTHEYCPAEDKAAGQRVSFKFSYSADAKQNHAQFGYSLYNYPDSDTVFGGLQYGVSQAKCGNNCPGYASGIKVAFPDDVYSKNCQPLICENNKGCDSKACLKEYRGNVHVHICNSKRSNDQDDGYYTEHLTSTINGQVVTVPVIVVVETSTAPVPKPTKVPASKVYITTVIPAPKTKT